MTEKEKIKQSLTLEDVKHDYLKYGYLNDAQVEWMIECLDDVAETLPGTMAKDRVFHQNIIDLRIKLDI